MADSIKYHSSPSLSCIKEGESKALNEMAQKMLAAGINPKTILEITGVEMDKA